MRTGMVSIGAREIARCPSNAGSAWRQGAVRCHIDASVEPYPGCSRRSGCCPAPCVVLRSTRRVEALLADRDAVAAVVRPMLTAWRQLREQIAVFDKAVHALAKNDPTCRLLMSVPGIGVVTVLAYVSTVGRRSRPLCPVAVGRGAYGSDTEAVTGCGFWSGLFMAG